MSNEGVDGVVQVQGAPQQQTVLPPQLRDHDGHQSAGERLETQDNRQDITTPEAGRWDPLGGSWWSGTAPGTHRVPGLPHRNLAGQDVQVLPGLAEVPELNTEESVSRHVLRIRVPVHGSCPGFLWSLLTLLLPEPQHVTTRICLTFDSSATHSGMPVKLTLTELSWLDVARTNSLSGCQSRPWILDR